MNHFLWRHVGIRGYRPGKWPIPSLDLVALIHLGGTWAGSVGAGERREDDGMRLNRGRRLTISLGGTLKFRRAIQGNASCSSPDLINSRARKVDIRLPGKGNSNSYRARPVHQIISMIKRIRTSRLSIKNSCSLGGLGGRMGGIGGRGRAERG